MTALAWTSEFDLGHRQMDDTHHDFVAAVNALAEAPDAALTGALDDLIAHCEPHFAQENRWSEELGMPPCHRLEHDRVLTVLRMVRGEVARGELALGRRLAEELPGWFHDHATSMDAALAALLNSGMTVAELQAKLAALGPAQAAAASAENGAAAATAVASAGSAAPAK